MLLSKRMLVGIYIGQFCITTLTYFFITWFPVYLARRGICRSYEEDSWRRCRRCAAPLAAFWAALFPTRCSGRPLADLCAQGTDRRRNAAFRHDDRLQLHQCAGVVMVLMSLAFFGKGFGALGWTVIADTSPKELIGLNGGLFNLFGNTCRDHYADRHWIHREENGLVP